MVPRERIELSTSPLPRVRSTTELPRLALREAGLLTGSGRYWKPSAGVGYPPPKRAKAA